MNQQDKVTLELRLRVTYDLNGVALKELYRLLDYAVRHLMGEGLITGETEAVVDDYRYEVKEVTVNG